MFELLRPTIAVVRILRLPTAVLARGLILAFVAVSCGTSTTRQIAATRCTQNSQCATPLVCRLEKCRSECATQRDCMNGLTCLLDSFGLGACQVLSEATCMNNTECPAPLTCQFGKCANQCVSDADCASGQRCSAGDAQAGACVVEMSSCVSCRANSDCFASAAGEYCGRDHCCYKKECESDRDCRPEQLCDTSNRCVARVFSVDAQVPPLDADMSMRADAFVRTQDSGGASAAEAGGGPGRPLFTGMNRTYVALGAGFSCARDVMDGNVYCWGKNSRGQFGNGTTEGVDRPTQLSTRNVETIGAGSDHVCIGRARSAGGFELRCSGDNGSSQSLPSGGLATSPNFMTPVTVSGLPTMGGPFFFALGPSHTCFIAPVMFQPAGQAWCFGSNLSGQVGTMPIGSVLPPTLVGGGMTFRSISAGRAHTCAIEQGTNQVWCWGEDTLGQLGDGVGAAPIPGIPVRVQFRRRSAPIVDDLRAQDISCGANHCCALIGMIPDEAPVVCWGDNTHHQACAEGVSCPAASGPADPTEDPPDPTLLGVAAAGDTSCVYGSSFVYCWGGATCGELGPGFDGPSSSSPTYFPDRNFVNIVDVFGGGPKLAPDPVAPHPAHFCARRSDGRLACWGDNTQGQLGRGFVPSLAPTCVKHMTAEFTMDVPAP